MLQNVSNVHYSALHHFLNVLEQFPTLLSLFDGLTTPFQWRNGLNKVNRMESNHFPTNGRQISDYGYSNINFVFKVFEMGFQLQILHFGQKVFWQQQFFSTTFRQPKI